MSKYKKITSLFLSLSLIMGIVQQPVSALNISPSSDDTPETVQITNADGSITEVPVLNDEETIELLNEQVEAEEYGALSSDYWDMVFEETCDMIKVKSDNAYITTEWDKELPLYKTAQENDFSPIKTYYLYGLYKLRTANNEHSFVGDKPVQGIYNQLFYSTLPYIADSTMDSRFTVTWTEIGGVKRPLANTILI